MSKLVENESAKDMDIVHWDTFVRLGVQTCEQILD